MINKDSTLYDVVGIGNAIVDVLAKVGDGFLRERSLPKGGMTLVEAADAGSDGNAKIRAAAGNTEILTLFEVEELDKALNRTNTVHAAVLKGGMAEMVRSQLRKWQNFNS